jgi:tetratricopeptide (TPR) repeat protein
VKKENLIIQNKFDLTLNSHKKNNLKVAEKLYKEIFEIKPNHLEAISYLGTLFAQTKKLNLAKTLFHKVIHNNDFYSTSGTRDLIFHVQEHQFTIPEISKILNDLDLEFLGFANPYLNHFFKKKYLQSFPDDKKNLSLDNWNQFEINNPSVFVGMYQFWVRKIKKI